MRNHYTITDPEKHFWSKVDQSAGPDACWPWTGTITSFGYGKVWFRQKRVHAHRVAWTLTNGPIPEGQCIRHKVCDNPPCCNPSHLAPGTTAQNVADRTIKKRSAAKTQNGRVKLTQADVDEIREKYASGLYKRSQLAAQKGVSHRQISNIVTHRNW